MSTMEDLEKRIQNLEDMRAIERLQAQYWDYLDAKNWDGLAGILVDDFVFINNTTRWALRRARWHARDDEGQVWRGRDLESQGHHHWIDITGPDTATSHWSLEDDLYDAENGGEFVGRAHYDNTYVKIDGRWYFTEMSLTYLRGKAEIKKRYEDTANAYKVFMM